MLKLSIIIINYNTKDYLEICLTSIYGSKLQVSFETIVVDNNSRDASVEMVRETFPQVNLIQSIKNTGFAAGNNLGFAHAKGQYVLLLNSDTKVVGDALEKIVSFLDKNPDVAVATARVVYPDLSDQGVARSFPTPMNAIFGRNSLLTTLFPNNKYSKKYLLSRTNTSNEPFEVDWVSGACLMVRRKVIDEVGALDEKFFMYWEDADLCYRIKQRGWQVVCIPDAVVIHYEGKSSQKKKSNHLIMEFNRSVYYYYRKHHINSIFSPINILAIFGLTLRAASLIIVNFFKKKECHNEKLE